MNNYKEVKRSFAIQAERFATYHMSKAEYTDYLLAEIDARGDEEALEVAAGTCICGRALAPRVKKITCLDLSDAMLKQGKAAAKRARIRNISFVAGNAERLPYKDGSFDLVITRLSLHHFVDPRVPFGEMRRVLKRGGKLVVWDMEATAEELREVNDRIEAMRDSSHTRILSRAEFEELFADGLDLQTEEMTLVPVDLRDWLDLTDTPTGIREDIILKMTAELDGKGSTGFYPYIRDGRIFFDHRWILLIGIKK